ncbi:MAG: transposase [Candidatus Solibacter usitatus]|nr:transposase [Candidatus Solibacter usitatus]
MNWRRFQFIAVVVVLLFAANGLRSANRAPLLPALIPSGSGSIKKLQALMADPLVDLWATDEVHFQQYGSSCRMWVPPEVQDPVLMHHPTRRSVGYFGAVRLRDGRFLFQRETKRFNAATFFVFLKELRRVSQSPNRRIVVIVDNARYHHAVLR